MAEKFLQLLIECLVLCNDGRVVAAGAHRTDIVSKAQPQTSGVARSWVTTRPSFNNLCEVIHETGVLPPDTVHEIDLALGDWLCREEFWQGGAAMPIVDLSRQEQPEISPARSAGFIASLGSSIPEGRWKVGAFHRRSATKFISLRSPGTLFPANLPRGSTAVDDQPAVVAPKK